MHADFEITALTVLGAAPLSVRVSLRYDVLTAFQPSLREQRVGTAALDWTRASDPSTTPPTWQLLRWQALTETLSVASAPGFSDVTAQALGHIPAYPAQLLRGSDGLAHPARWRLRHRRLRQQWHRRRRLR